MHPIGQEKPQPIQTTQRSQWIGDLPSGEPNDWFVHPEELEKLLEYERAGYDPSEANELLEDERLIDEW
jgi:hypothetical protein